MVGSMPCQVYRAPLQNLGTLQNDPLKACVDCKHVIAYTSIVSHSLCGRLEFIRREEREEGREGGGGKGRGRREGEGGRGRMKEGRKGKEEGKDEGRKGGEGEEGGRRIGMKEGGIC